MTIGVLILVGLAVVFALIVVWVLRKGRRLPGDHVFRASRLSRGNRIFPTQVVITPSSVTHYTPQLVGKLEESIHMSHVASIKIDTNLMFSDVLIETTGGHNPVRCHGHSKGDAIQIKKLIEEFQTAYYRANKQ
ncbi:MAG TPA: hypothetical protein VFV98_07335 [Vicinamibacterales bacterium]|nr:hypothetical protein [Vicinamibacterales bacterium]